MASVGHPDGSISEDSDVFREANEDQALLGSQAQSQPLWVRLACILLNLLIEAYDQIRIVPEIVLFERSICESYYSVSYASTVGRPRERLCKIEPVQRQLANLRGWKAFFDGVAIFVVAIPMGALADRFGRMKVLASSIFGPIAATSWLLLIGYDVFGWANIRLAWFSSLFFVFGNLSSANATVYAIAADACPPSDRSRYFYYLYSTFLVCELFAPALASITINRSLLIPFGVGIAAMCFCYPILAFMPETHKTTKSRPPKSRHGISDALSEVGTEAEAQALVPPAATAESGGLGATPGFTAVLTQKNLILAFIVLFVGALRQATVSVLLQYAAARFDWPLSQTAMLISAIGAMNIVLFLLILPQCIGFLTSQWHVPAQIIDHAIVSASLGILALGSLFMALAPSTGILILSVLLFAAGYGTRVAVLSLITVWTSEDIRARTFAVAQIVENVGRMCADPVLLKIFAISLHFDGLLQGLPFFVAAAGFAVGAVAWRFVHLNSGT